VQSVPTVQSIPGGRRVPGVLSVLRR
jgi:hypothetical protein